MKAVEILRRLQAHGLESISNTEQFKLEGRFSKGGPKAKKIGIWAVKAYQIRIYGGFIQLDDSEIFVCEEAVKKKKNKANREQLERVAKTLGGHDV